MFINNFLYAVNFFFGTLMVAFEYISLNALLPTFLLVSFVVFMVILFFYSPYHASNVTKPRKFKFRGSLSVTDMLTDSFLFQ